MKDALEAFRNLNFQTLGAKIEAGMQLFFSFFFFFLLVRFINRGKRSEMVSVVSRYERNEI